MDFIRRLFDTSDFPARWSCGQWTSGHGWLHVLSDLGVWSAYVAIPCVLVYFLLRRDDLPFRGIFLLFGAFILACGTTHLMEAVIFWWPAYRLSGLIKLLTAVVSWATVIALVPVVPRALAMRSPEELQQEVEARKQAEAALHRANDELELRIQQRTAELSAANAALWLERERFRTTLASIGDAVIATDALGRVTFQNAVAEGLTGWGAEALGRPLPEVFRIVNEQTGEPVDSPVEKVLREGTIVGLANHTVLIDKGGTPRPIDDSGAPIRGGDGAIAGVVLVFRDVTERRRAEEALHRAHADLEQRVEERTAELARTARFQTALLDSLQEGIVACDGSGMLTLFNGATREMHGLPQEPVPAERWADHYDLYGPDGTTRMSKDEVPLFRALRGERVRDAEMVIAPKGGEPRFLLASGQAFHDGEGRLLGAVVSMHDITRRRRAEEALRRAYDELEARVAERTAALGRANDALLAEVAERRGAEERVQRVADAVPALISYIGPDARYRLNNRAYETWFGVPRGSLPGRHMRDVLGERAWQAIRSHVEAALAGEVVSYEAEVPYREGGTRWIAATYTPDPGEGGEVRGIVAHVNDITRRKALEVQLRERAEQLAEADRRKDDFLAVLSHELRNPLAPLRNGLQVLKLAGGDADAGEQARGMMERQLGQMVHLINDLMDLSRISRGKVELKKERIDLATALRGAVETSLPLIEAARHELAVALPAEPIWVDADVTRLAQVFSNLLNNAAKYTPEGGRITLTARAEQGTALVAVADTGVGIPEAMLPLVFEMFTQVDRSLEKAQGGLGIGLTIVRRLVEMHAGRVEAKSGGPGRGSEFVVTLPAAAGPEATPAARPAEPAPRAAARTVLVVDDNQDSAASLALMLTLMGHEVRTAADGLEAVEAAAAHQPDLILMDVGMPRLNGLEATRRIREQPRGRDIVIVALTGWGQEEDRRKSQQAGCDGHLVKPVDPAALQRLLAGLRVEPR